MFCTRTKCLLLDEIHLEVPVTNTVDEVMNAVWNIVGGQYAPNNKKISRTLIDGFNHEREQCLLNGCALQPKQTLQDCGLSAGNETNLVFVKQEIVAEGAQERSSKLSTLHSFILCFTRVAYFYSRISFAPGSLITQL